MKATRVRTALAIKSRLLQLTCGRITSLSAIAVVVRQLKGWTEVFRI